MSSARDLRTIAVGRVLLLAFAVAMFVATWASWPNLIIDSGREMYVPAVLLQGKQLYRDVWYPYGPLAPFVNALLFGAFGVHLNTLYGAGLAVISGSALVLHSIARRFMPPIAALVCGLGFLAQGFQSDLFNNILPYSFAATFSALLCLLTLLFLLRYLEHRAGPNLVLAGLFAALAVVTKYESLLPCDTGLASGVLLHAWHGKHFWRSLRAGIFALLPGIAVAGVVYGWLVHKYGVEFLIHANWMSVPGSYFIQHYGSLWVRGRGLRFIPSEIAKVGFYSLIAMSLWFALAFLLYKKRWLTAAGGVFLIAFLSPFIRHVFPSLAFPVFGNTTAGMLARGLLVVAMVGAGLFFLSRAVLTRSAPPPAVMLIFGMGLLFALRSHVTARDLVFPQGMFLIVLGFAILCIIGAIRYRQAPLPALIVTVGMGLMLSLRVMVNIRPTGYAIYSSSLLFLVFMIVLWWVVDRVHRNAQSRARSISVAAYFAVFAILFARMAFGFYQELPWPLIHTPLGDVRRTPWHMALVTDFLPVMQQAKSRGEKVLLLPELTGLYFIAGMQSPSRYESLTPGTLEPGKYTEIFLREMESNPPDLIIVSNRRTSEYGVDYFGLDYDQAVLEWIERRYRLTGEIGHFERKSDAPLAALMYRPKN